MKRFAAQYIITASGDILKRGVVTCNDTGTITNISLNDTEFKETSATAYYNGIIVPGFVNCHSHIELSDMKGIAPRGMGLGSFIRDVRNKRNPSAEKALKAIKQADRELYLTGTSALADICNTDITFDIKEKSKINYVNLLEVFGIDPEKASRRIDEIKLLKEKSEKYRSPSYIVPHSVYSLSQPLFKEVSLLSAKNDITSIHFLESTQERQFVDEAEGELLSSYLEMGISPKVLDMRVPGHIYAIGNYLPGSGNLILVHNTFADNEIIEALQKRDNTFWCLCPNSNLYIEDTLPPVEEIRKSNGTIVLGTDSLASNDSLNLLEEVKTLQFHFPSIGLPEMIEWSSRNGAEALQFDRLGSIEVGKSPGLVLLENCDLANLRLSADSKSVRLI